MMQGSAPLEGGGFSSFLGVLRRRLWVVIVCAIAVPVAAVAYSKSRPQLYQADSSVLLQSDNFAATVAGDSSSQGGDAAAAPDLPTEQRIASLPVIAERTAKALKWTVTPAEVSSSVSTSTDGEASLLTFTVQNRVPVIAARIADAYAKQYIEYRRSSQVDRLKAANVRLAGQTRALQARLNGLLARPVFVRNRGRLGLDSFGNTIGPAAGAVSPSLGTLRDRIQAIRAQVSRLRSRQQDVSTLLNLQSGNATLVQSASVPSTPTSPRVKRNAFLGMFLGIMLGVLLAALLELLDRRMRQPSEVEEVYQQPIVGAIPRTPVLKKRAPLNELPPFISDAFRMVHDNVCFFNVDRPVRSILVTSASPGDGKTTVAWALAAAAAESAGRGESGSSVLVVEADLRRSSLAERLGVEKPVGLSDMVSGQLSLTEAVAHIPVHPSENGEDAPTVDVLFAGTPQRNPRGVLGSKRMGEIILEAQARYDLVILDAPPAAIVSDAIPLIKQVSGVLVVARLRRSRRDAAERLREQLMHLHAKPLGVVVNGIDPHDGVYGSAYVSATQYADQRR